MFRHLILSRKLRTLIMINLFTIILCGLPAVSAQAISVIHICVMPRNGERPPYVMSFQQTGAFGVLIPQEADVVIYSNQPLSTGLYTINTDASTGGYRALETLAIVDAATIIPTQVGCRSGANAAIISGSTFSTIPLPISINHALIIQMSGMSTSVLTDNPLVRGVLAFNFRPGSATNTSNWINFQILQMLGEEGPVIEFAVPFIPPGTAFTIIANKLFSIGQSQPEAVPPRFPEYLTPANSVVTTVQPDLQALYGLNIFEVMAQGGIRIYPDSGINDVYRGGYFQLSIRPQETSRRLPEGGNVRALAGAEASIVLLNRFNNNPFRINAPFGAGERTDRIQGNTTVRIVRIEPDTGQLVVIQGSSEAIIQSWLVELAD